MCGEGHNWHCEIHLTSLDAGRFCERALLQTLEVRARPRRFLHGGIPRGGCLPSEEIPMRVSSHGGNPTGESLLAASCMEESPMGDIPMGKSPLGNPPWGNSPRGIPTVCPAGMHTTRKVVPHEASCFLRSRFDLFCYRSALHIG